MEPSTGELRARSQCSGADSITTSAAARAYQSAALRPGIRCQLMQLWGVGLQLRSSMQTASHPATAVMPNPEHFREQELWAGQAIHACARPGAWSRAWAYGLPHVKACPKGDTS